MIQTAKPITRHVVNPLGSSQWKSRLQEIRKCNAEPWRSWWEVRTFSDDDWLVTVVSKCFKHESFFP